MPNNTSATFSADVQAYLAEKVLPIAKRQLTAYAFADKIKLPKNMGTTYTATRYSRLPLPVATLSEGVPSVSETMTISQASATVQQWGDSVQLTDVAELTIKHDVFQQAVRLTAIQMSETLERNAYTGSNGLLAGTNINYSNGRANRAGLTTAASDSLSPSDIYKAVGAMTTLGVPRFDSRGEDSYEVGAGTKVKPYGAPVYAAITHPLVAQDFRSNSTVSTAWQYSDVERLYGTEVGVWNGVAFTTSNMVPYWANAGAGPTPAASSTGGSFATATWYTQVVGCPAQTGMEQQIYNIQSVAVTSPNVITMTTPNVPGMVYNVYVSATNAQAGMTIATGTYTGAPTTGGAAGFLVGVPANTAVTLTAVSTYNGSQIPPSQPGSGVTVFPTFIVGKGAYAVVDLDEPRFEYLREADKSDRHNQLRVIAWKVFYGMMITNQAFFMRIESNSQFSPSFTSGTPALSAGAATTYGVAY